jgi:putative ABC transport system permease protein
VTPGAPGSGRGGLPSLTLNYVSPDYFRVLGTRLIEGRPFLPTDRPTDAKVAIIDAATVRDTWRGESIVGRCLELSPGQPCVTIVGIAEPRRIGSLRQERQEIFYSLAQGSTHVPQAILVRPAGRVADAVPVVAAAIRRAAPKLPYVSVRPLEDYADVQARSWHLGARLFGLFGGIAVVLAAIGLHASLAFAVRQRTAEFGVRMTLGADPRRIARLVLREGLTIMTAGWILGLGAAAWFVNSIKGLLYGVAPTDPLTATAATAVVVAAGLVGCLVPALRAARVDPVRALRTE